MKLLLFFFGVLLASPVLGLTTTQLTFIEGVLKSFFDAQNPIDDAAGTPGITRAGILRLAFHDCGTWDPVSRTGGCHAYMAIECPVPNTCEYTSTANRGLQTFVNMLENLYIENNLRVILSRADFWHLAAKYAVEYSAELAGTNITIPFQWGRTDCPACPLPYFPGRLPNAAKGFPEIERVFGRLGFSLFESTALIGAHCMGFAKRNNSGYTGQWDLHPDWFTNEFFLDLVFKQWVRRYVPPVIPDEPGKMQFSIPISSTNNAHPVPDLLNVLLMLPTDFSLLYNGAVDSNCNATLNPATSCTFNDLTAGYVRQFAANNTYFLQSFAPTFSKLQTLGGDTLYPVTYSDGNPGPFHPAHYIPCPPTSSTGSAGSTATGSAGSAGSGSGSGHGGFSP